MSQRLILLTGATGYIGGRLLERLLSRGEQVRCMTRRPESLSDRAGARCEVVAGDVMDPPSLAAPLQGVDIAYYLIHSMGATGDFEKDDRDAATNFAEAARDAGVKKIIYVGGLGHRDKELSKHLRSRQETGDVLRSTGVPVIEFRASIVIGSGSLSFELIRALVERLPIMICPKWVEVMSQPIAIDDLLDYLTCALDTNGNGSQIFEIGGPDQISYGGIMREYARQRGLRRWMIPVPLLTPYLSSLWLGLITPIYARIGRKLIESLRNPTLVSNNLALKTFPVQPRGIQDAIARAIVNEDHEFAQTRWSDAVSSAGAMRRWGGVRLGSRLVDSRTIQLPVPPEQAFQPVTQIGGSRGWYYADWLWHLRGWLDLLVGGVGSRRGRRDPNHLRPGDTLDFWRVEKFEPNRLLRLQAEMKLPGRAWLEFEVEPAADGCRLRQTAMFDPRGLFGLCYWYAMYPLHQFVFAGMLRRIAQLSREPAVVANFPQPE